jgi:hypothetical protein
MKKLLSLSVDGQHFVYCCPHCTTFRQEHVAPDRNPLPFSFLPNCTGCMQPIQVDHIELAFIQASYARALGKKMPAPVAHGAGSGEEKKHISGSPAYSAFTRADAVELAG